jgi:hypothetical protein
MYRFSRSIYRDLAPRVVEDPHDDGGCRNRQDLLEACEGAIRRISTDRRYFARPARSLFNEVRMHFAMSDQLFVWNVIDTNISLCLELLETAPELLQIDGGPRECRAHTRKGTPCQREPLPGRDYCPSHKHLEESFDDLLIEHDVFSDELVSA